MTHSLLFLLSLVTFVEADSLTFILHTSKSECFYEDKTKGQTIDTRFEVTTNTKINFAIFGPDKTMIEEHKKVDMVETNLMVKETGQYAYCFSGRNLVSDTQVMFDYNLDAEIEKEESATKKFNEEKVDFLNGVKEELRSSENYKKKVNMTAQFMMDVVRNNRDLLNHLEENKVAENSMLYLSILADRMEKFLAKHKTKHIYHFNVQEENLLNVDLFSTIICGGMLLSACVQLIVIKSFFTGSLSWKVWQF